MAADEKLNARMAKARRAYNINRASDTIIAVMACKYASTEVKALCGDIQERLAMLAEENIRG